MLRQMPVSTSVTRQSGRPLAQQLDLAAGIGDDAVADRSAGASSGRIP